MPPVAPFGLEAYLGDRRMLIEAALLARAESRWADVPIALLDAMRYSLFGRAKRLRPLLTLAAAEAVGGKPRGPVIEYACAVELVHTYSLIHDDLPCMDDDDLRRGRPTNHRVFGVALAVLAGDALLTEAFRFLSDVPGAVARHLAAELSSAAGAEGMVGGQALDVGAPEDRNLGAEAVIGIHRRKTALLMASAVAGGAAAAGAPVETVDRLREFGILLGLAFQATDDLLDMRPSAGARTGIAPEKVTLATALGDVAAKRWAAEQGARAEALLEGLASPGPLRALTRFAVDRSS